MSNPTATMTLANCFVVVDDQEAALRFYRDVLGLEVRQDVTQGDFRWLSLACPTMPSVEITLQSVAGYPGMSQEDRDAMADMLAKGVLTPLIFACDDVDAVFEHVTAAGAEVVQEPADQFYGVRDCAFRDPAGNMVRVKADLPG
jgi:uncharacterized glyoxalase superfamily protein PhnB